MQPLFKDKEIKIWISNWHEKSENLETQTNLNRLYGQLDVGMWLLSFSFTKVIFLAKFLNVSNPWYTSL